MTCPPGAYFELSGTRVDLSGIHAPYPFARVKHKKLAQVFKYRDGVSNEAEVDVVLRPHNIRDSECQFAVPYATPAQKQQIEDWFNAGDLVEFSPNDGEDRYTVRIREFDPHPLTYSRPNWDLEIDLEFHAEL